jgi:hypothetical protein
MDDDLSPSRLHHKIDGEKKINCLYIGGISYVLQEIDEEENFAEISAI